MMELGALRRLLIIFYIFLRRRKKTCVLRLSAHNNNPNTGVLWCIYGCKTAEKTQNIASSDRYCFFEVMPLLLLATFSIASRVLFVSFELRAAASISTQNIHFRSRINRNPIFLCFSFFLCVCIGICCERNSTICTIKKKID